jgi:hypothetical protein
MLHPSPIFTFYLFSHFCLGNEKVVRLEVYRDVFFGGRAVRSRGKLKDDPSEGKVCNPDRAAGAATVAQCEFRLRG